MSKVKCRKSTVNCQQFTVNSGFTLVEMLIVISIIGILAAAVITIIDPVARQRALRDTLRKRRVAEIAQAVEAYCAENGAYPDNKEALTSGLNPYLRGWPEDPPHPGGGASVYGYTRYADGVSYCILVNEETHEGRYIRYRSDTGELEENTNGC